MSETKAESNEPVLHVGLVRIAQQVFDIVKDGYDEDEPVPLSEVVSFVRELVARKIIPATNSDREQPIVSEAYVPFLEQAFYLYRCGASFDFLKMLVDSPITLIELIASTQLRHMYAQDAD